MTQPEISSVVSRERAINQIRHIVRISFALGHAKGRGVKFDQKPELDNMIQKTLEMFGLSRGDDNA